MKRLQTRAEFEIDNSLTGSDLWLLTQYEAYVFAQRFKVRRDDVSKNLYLYGVEASHFNSLITSQETFVSVRIVYVESVIRQIQAIDMELRDNERLMACIKARSWLDELGKEVDG